jgi:FkbM family methyltransferase
MHGGPLNKSLPMPVFRLLKSLRNFYLLRVKGDENHKTAVRWFADRGDETLRLDYPLDRNSVVFDLGGYKGDFAHDISARYDCQVYLFEPVREFYETCRDRFAGKDNIRCFHFGLSSQDGTFQISNEDNGSSIVKGNASGGEEVRVESFTQFVADHGIPAIDLIKINIEGGEYDVLPQVISSGFIGKTRFLQIQFHDFIEAAVQKRDAIRRDLARTHRESWNYPFVWESWEIKAD